MRDPHSDNVGKPSPLEDETGLDKTVMAADAGADDTIIVPDGTPTGMAELAWSHDDAWADLPTSKDAHPRSRLRSLGRWGIASTAALTAGVAAIWFGTVFYHDEESAPGAKQPVAVHVPNPPAPAPPPTPNPAPPPPAAAPPPVEPPHAQAKYPYISVALSDLNASGGRSVGFGYAPTREYAVDQAMAACQRGGNGGCAVQATILNQCVAVAIGRHGLWGTAFGPSRSEATSAAKSDYPGYVVQTSCPWDGND